MTVIRPGIEHDEWKSRTLSLREDVLAAADENREALQEVFNDYFLHWFPELTIDD